MGINACLLLDKRRLELLAAVRTAEVVGRAVVLERVLGAADGDGHAADRICRVLDEDVLRAGVPPRDELGEDRDGDLLLGGGAEIETRRGTNASAGFLVETQ